MKPDWKDAPTGARWLAQDSDGSWGWHSSKPFVNETGPCSLTSSHKGYWDHKNVPKVWQNAGKDEPNPRWKTTLEARS
jgi:hypothetical protein